MNSFMVWVKKMTANYSYNTSRNTGSRLLAYEMRDKAYQICSEFLSGSWKKISSSDMVFETVSGGLSNELFYCSLPSTHTPLNGEPSQVLMRMYGQIHHEAGGSSTVTESVIFMMLSERKLGPKLYGVFTGGRLEEYIPARAMTCKELRDPILSSIIARKLASVHSLNVPINKEPTWLFETINKWLSQIRANDTHTSYDDPAKRDIISELMDFDFESEIRWLENDLRKVKSPVMFCHNDLQEGNILIAEQKRKFSGNQLSGQKVAQLADKVVLIDFEYCSYNYRGFDLANHFCEWAFDYSNPNYPHFYSNLKNYPTRAEQKYFINEYLRSSSKSGEPDQLASVERLLAEAAHFALASHLMWTLWSINNAFTSQINFGYLEYGKARLNAYVLHKQQLLCERALMGNWMPKCDNS